MGPRETSAIVELVRHPFSPLAEEGRRVAEKIRVKNEGEHRIRLSVFPPE